ncbi:hypothetical protein CMI37_38470 [Candidatus Pacearchaeota archaeon]|nr:hypothetical protein [Candidatus Pacearchaeota archaeon]|tara:strand:+ start:4606 stop:4869 length:264 start_codon:yes stop_codon:yes gene_type:complete
MVKTIRSHTGYEVQVLTTAEMTKKIEELEVQGIVVTPAMCDKIRKEHADTQKKRISDARKEDNRKERNMQNYMKEAQNERNVKVDGK